MNDRNKEAEVKVPISVILDMARREIEEVAFNCMKANNIPPSLMANVLEGVLLSITQMKINELSEEIIKVHKATCQEGEDGD